MTALCLTTHTRDPLRAHIKCDNGKLASLYFIAGKDGPEVALVNIPSKVAHAAAASFNDAMAEAEVPRLEDLA